MPTRKSIIESSIKVCSIKYGEPIKAKIKVSIPKLPAWYAKENKHGN